MVGRVRTGLRLRRKVRRAQPTPRCPKVFVGLAKEGCERIGIAGWVNVPDRSRHVFVLLGKDPARPKQWLGKNAHCVFYTTKNHRVPLRRIGKVVRHAIAVRILRDKSFDHIDNFLLLTLGQFRNGVKSQPRPTAWRDHAPGFGLAE